MRSLFVFACILITLPGVAQFGKKEKSLNLADTTTWHDGTVIKADGSQMAGILRFNDHIGTLSFSDGQEEYTFSPGRVAGFYFVDKQSGKTRYFYALENYNEKMKLNKKDFYELLFDFKSFTMWSMVDQLESKVRSHTPPPTATQQHSGVIYYQKFTVQVEVIYLMAEDEKLIEFLRVESRERGDHLPDSPDETTKGDLNHNLINQFIGDDKYKMLKAYAKRNNLNWRKKQDVINIMEFYGTL